MGGAQRGGGGRNGREGEKGNCGQDAKYINIFN